MVIVLNFLNSFFFLFCINSFPIFFCFLVFFLISLLELVPSIFTSFSSILHFENMLRTFTLRQLLSWTLRSLLRWDFSEWRYLDGGALIWLFQWLGITSFKLPRRDKVVALLRCHHFGLFLLVYVWNLFKLWWSHTERDWGITYCHVKLLKWRSQWN